MMADNSQNSSSLMDCTNSTIYRLNGSECENSNELNESTNLTDSSHGSSIRVTDSSHTLEDFPGFSQGDSSPDTEMKDPFNAIFYHVSPLKDSTNITFYNRPLYENILQVLSKEFANFPSQSAKTFRIKTHVDRLKCFLTIDRSVLSLCASGPGHTIWREKKFKKLSENMYRSFVKETDSVLNTSLLDQDNSSLSGSQVSTQQNQSGLISILEETAEKETPGVVIRQELPSTNTDPQDTPVMRKISVLMEMIHSLQGDVRSIQSNIMTLTKEVNELATQALYKTVDETHIDEPSPGTVIEIVNETELSERNDRKLPTPSSQQNRPYSEVVKDQGLTDVLSQQDANRQSATSTIPQHSADGLQRTSTPKTTHQQHTGRPLTTPKVNQQPRPVSHPETRAQPSKPMRHAAKKVLLMGDSVISPVNPRGLKKEVFKHSIPGARIDHIFDQSNIFNMSQFSEVILFVGGNDASNSNDMEYFEELYEQVILNLKQVNDTCQIYLCNMTPRSDTDVSEVNQAIHRLCQEHNLTLVDINKAFYDRQGKIIERYYGDDLIHMSTSGVKRLLGEINKEFDIVDNFENCAFKSRNQKKSHFHRSQTNSHRSYNGRRSGRPTQNRVTRSINNAVACYKCGETNHETSRCKFQEQLKCHYCGFWGHKSGRCLNQ